MTAINHRFPQATAKAVAVFAGEDRFGTPLQIADWRFECKISGKDNGGALCLFDTRRTGKGGPPLHVHRGQDEWFYVREGEFLFKIGEDMYYLKPGDTLLAPRNVPHAFASLSETSAVLVAFQPAGTVEKLFQDVQARCGPRAPTPDDWRAVARHHDVEILGAPLDVA